MAIYIGHVSAYAIAKANGYEGTEEEFGAMLGQISITLGDLTNLRAVATTRAAGSQATASYADGVLTLGIPRGDKGETGNGIQSVAKTGTSGTNPVVDTYTITYTNGQTTTFQITNGIKGDTGATPELTIGTVTTGEVGSDAAATITGTPEHPVLGLTLPRGATGDVTNLAGTFSSASAYSAGDYVIYNDLLYVFNADHAAGSWTGTDATQVKVGTELSALKEDLTHIETDGLVSVPVTNWQNGYINNIGNVFTSSLSKFALIPMSENESIRVRTNNTNTTIIGYTTADSVAVGDNVNVLYSTSADGNADFTYYANESINIVICVLASNYTVDYLVPTKVYDAATLASNLYSDKDKVEKTLTWNNGYVSSAGTVSNSTKSQYTLVSLVKGETVVVGTANDSIAIISITADNNSPSVGGSVIPYQTTSSAQYEEYSYTADQNVNIVICVAKYMYKLAFFKPRNTQEIPTIDAIINDGYYTLEQLFNGTFSNQMGDNSILTYFLSNRIRTELITIHAGDAIVINNGSFQHACGIWEGTFTKDAIKRNDFEWIDTTETIEVAYDGYLVVVFRKSTNESIVPASFDGSIKVYPNVFNRVVNNNLSKDEVRHNTKSARHVLSGANSPLTILHFSDLHEDADALARIMLDRNELGNLVDDAICTGDMVANTYAHITSWWDKDVLTCIGNHDSASYSDEYDWTALSMADRDAYYIAPFESNWGIVHTSGKSYYYKDYASSKVRMVVMDGMLYTDNGSEATEQNAWLSDLLDDAIANNLHVLIAIHAPHGGSTSVDCSFHDYTYTVMPTESDCTTPQAVIDIVANAISGGLKFVGYICGHTHRDNIWKATEDGSQLMYCVTCANVSYPPQWMNADLYRGVDADAYNLVTIDTSRTLVKLVRGGGADINDHMNIRKAICFNYSTGEKVGEVL